MLAKAKELVAEKLEGKTIVKEIYVKNRDFIKHTRLSLYIKSSRNNQ